MTRPAPEMILVIAAICRGQRIVAQTAIMGAIVSNLSLVLGICLVVGSWNQRMDNFPHHMAVVNARLLLITMVALVNVTLFVHYSDGRSPIALRASSHCPI